MGLEVYPKLIVSLENNGNNLGHAGQDITIFLRGYEKIYGKENAKAEIINALRHELEHFKQDIIIYIVLYTITKLMGSSMRNRKNTYRRYNQTLLTVPTLSNRRRTG